MSFSGLTVTAERATASDFTLAVLLDPFTVGIRNPEVFDPPSTRINMDVYVSVFTRELWLSCLGLGIITSLVHWFVCTLSHAGRFEANQKHVETIIQSIIFFLSSLALIGQTESGSKKRFKTCGIFLIHFWKKILALRILRLKRFDMYLIKF